MQTLRDIHVCEALARAERGRHNRTRAPGDEGPRRPLARLARLLGRALIALGARLLAYGGERARVRAARLQAELAPYVPPPTFSRN